MSGLIINGNDLSLDIPAIRRATWTSALIPVNGIPHYTDSIVAWGEVLPAGTQITVLAALGDGSAWIEVENGGEIPQLIYGQPLNNLALRLRVSLSTTDPSASPVISSLSLAVNGVNFPVTPGSGTPDRLVERIYSPISRDPEPVLALRLSYDGAMTWKVDGYTLTTSVNGGSGANISVFLPMFTLATLAEWLASQPGYSIPWLNEGIAENAAICLIDEAGDVGLKNGDHLHAYSAVLWHVMEAIGYEVSIATDAVGESLKQMSILSAESLWLDQWGDYLAVPRLSGEQDDAYRGRVVREPIRLLCNNLALEQMVADQTGLAVRIVDLDWRTSNILLTNVPADLFQGSPVFRHITNSTEFVCGPFAADSPKLDFLASLGISVGAAGYPYWGDPGDDNPLVCAFAVLLGSADYSDAEKYRIKQIIEYGRMGGTAALYYLPERLLHSNTAGETTNSDYVVGPGAGTYTQIQL